MKKWYGVSFGNGNDGVLRSFPDFYVKTDRPAVLAHGALIDNVRDDATVEWAAASAVVQHKEGTVSATLFEGPRGETERGAAWVVCEVFPVEVTFDRPMGPNRPTFNSIELALTPEARELAETNITQEHEEDFQALLNRAPDLALFSCYVNGEPSAAIVRITRGENNFLIEPLFVSVTKSMKIADHEGEQAVFRSH